MASRAVIFSPPILGMGRIMQCTRSARVRGELLREICLQLRDRGVEVRFRELPLANKTRPRDVLTAPGAYYVERRAWGQKGERVG